MIINFMNLDIFGLSFIKYKNVYSKNKMSYNFKILKVKI